MCQEGLAILTDRLLHPIERIFFYLPLEHSEDLAMQRQSIYHFQRLQEEAPLPLQKAFGLTRDYAIRHFEVVVTFDN